MQKCSPDCFTDQMKSLSDVKRRNYAKSIGLRSFRKYYKSYIHVMSQDVRQTTKSNKTTRQVLK